MLYEILVKERVGERLGRVVHYQEKSKASWGLKERLPHFSIVDWEGTEEELKHLIENGKHEANNFVDRSDNAVFLKTEALKEGDFKYSYQEEEDNQELIAKQLNGGVSVQDACGSMNIFEESIGIDQGNQRKYFLKAIYPMRKAKGIKDCLLAFKYGSSYASTYKSLNELTDSVKTEVKKILTPKVLKDLQDRWGILK